MFNNASHTILDFCNTSGWFTSNDSTIPEDRLVQKIIAFIPAIGLFALNRVKERKIDQESMNNTSKTIKLFNVTFHYQIAMLVQEIAFLGICILGLSIAVTTPQFLCFGAMAVLSVFQVHNNVTKIVNNRQSANKLLIS